VVLALGLWLAVTVVLAVPVSLLLRRLDVVDDDDEPIDYAELDEAMSRHPSRRSNAA